MRLLLPCLAAMMLAACGTTARNPDGTFAIPDQYAHAPAVHEEFMSQAALDRTCGKSGKDACAIGEDTSHCWAAFQEWLRIENGPLLDYVRHHERAHCAGWHHQGE